MHSTSNSRSQSDDALQLYSQIQENNDALSLTAIQFITKILNEYTLSHLAFSFNAGKDCMVLLYLIRIALKLSNKNEADLEIIWFQRNNEFPQLMEFLKFCVKKYQFPLFQTCNDYKHGLEKYLATGNPLCRGVFLGQRTTDPWCANLDLSTHCTSGWPDIMRINPILYWTYNDIWTFLKKYDLEYCSLYDHGYTSLGDVRATVPNPLLYDKHLIKFKSANMLTPYEHAERFGRLITNRNQSKENLIRNKIKCLIIAGTHVFGADVLESIKIAIESSFIDGILRKDSGEDVVNMSVDIECIEKDANDLRFKWCKDNYLYLFYANVSDDSE